MRPRLQLFLTFEELRKLANECGELRTAGAVIFFNVSSPNSGTTRARSSVSVINGCGLPDRRSLVPDPFFGVRHEQLLSQQVGPPIDR